MKIRKSSVTQTEKVELQMTPMIDVVFQLLSFFLFSFKIVTQEGDFSINMPRDAAASSETPEDIKPIRITLRSNPNGELSAILLGNQPIASLAGLHSEIMSMAGGAGGPTSAASLLEVELDCDYDLHYEHTVNAINQIVGHVTETGEIVKLIDRIKFSPPKPPNP